MAVVVASETTGVVDVSQVVRIRSPSYLEIGEDVAAVDGSKRLTSGSDFGGTLGGSFRESLLVEIG
jgi:hypothetical protein